MNNRPREDRSVLALLYDDYRRIYPESAVTIQREIETLYQQLYLHALANPEVIAAVFVGMIDDRERYAYEAGVKCGVQLALDLELDSTMHGGGSDVCDR